MTALLDADREILNMTTVRYPLRMPAETLAALKDEHARTFPSHRLSFNLWLKVGLVAYYRIPLEDITL